MRAVFQGFMLIILSVLAITSFAWNATGHMVIAEIAYQRLEPSVRDKVDRLVASLHEEYRYISSFQQLAYWPDMIRSQKIETYTHWHYIDIPFSTDGSVLKNIIDTDNAVWALQHIQKVVKNARANPYERARFLAFMIHIVGDLHQPLHTVSNITAAYPDGDQGGNLYFIRYNNKRVNLHKVWDEGVGVFQNASRFSDVNELVRNITTRYPENYFGERGANTNFDAWALEGMVNA